MTTDRHLFNDPDDPELNQNPWVYGGFSGTSAASIVAARQPLAGRFAARFARR